MHWKSVGTNVFHFVYNCFQNCLFTFKYELDLSHRNKEALVSSGASMVEVDFPLSPFGGLSFESRLFVVGTLFISCIEGLLADSKQQLLVTYHICKKQIFYNSYNLFALSSNRNQSAALVSMWFFHLTTSKVLLSSNYLPCLDTWTLELLAIYYFMLYLSSYLVS